MTIIAQIKRLYESGQNYRAIATSMSLEFMYVRGALAGLRLVPLDVSASANLSGPYQRGLQDARHFH